MGLSNSHTLPTQNASAVIVGCGRMGVHPSDRAKGDVPAGWLPLAHIEALKIAASDISIGLCDTNSEALEKWGAHYKVHNTFTDFRSAIEKMTPKVVCLATRTPAKREIIEFCCERKVPGLYIEKPIANSIDGCRELLNQIEASGTRISYGVNRRFHALYRVAKSILDRREIGDLVEINLEFGESPLLWTHPHTVDLVMFFSNSAKLKSVSAQLDPNTVSRKSEHLVDSDPVVRRAHFEFENGITANITRARGHGVRICGSLGTIMISANGASIVIDKKTHAGSPYFLQHSSETALHLESATVTAIRELLLAIESKSSSPMPHEAIQGGMEMLAGCVWSGLHEGRTIGAQSIPPELTITGRVGELYA